MNVLVIGSGGREHALCWKIKQSPKVRRVYCAPGNAGIAEEAKCVDIKETDIDSLLRFAIASEIDLTVVGPEIPLALGIVDRFEEHGLRIFGPTKAAARIESSKSFAKNLLKKYRIPTGFFSVFSDFTEALRWVEEVKPPLVIKADGLAAGKGVVVCRTEDEARDTLDAILNGRLFGDAGDRVVIEEFLEGQEVSFLAFTDGDTLVPLPSSQDHKQLLDGDQGPNTGGMGAYSPTPFVTSELQDRIMKEVMIPAVRAMKEEGYPYKGVLYAGLMLTDGRFKVLEFNCRFGDPEAQVLLTRMDSDIVPIFEAAIEGRLSAESIKWKSEASACVVMASKGYPGDYKKGAPIEGLDEVKRMERVKVFHAGTALRDGCIVTNGGRVLGVTALGDTIRDAVETAYRAVKAIRCEQLQYRTDIGGKAIRFA
jgi:phosphoribosylamine--glycine ligase